MKFSEEWWAQEGSVGAGFVRYPSERMDLLVHSLWSSGHYFPAEKRTLDIYICNLSACMASTHLGMDGGERKERGAREFVIFPTHPVLDPFFALLCLCLRLL